MAAEAFNWAKMSGSKFKDNTNMSEDIDKLKKLYYSIWMACAKEQGVPEAEAKIEFENFFKKCLSGIDEEGKTVNGATFMSKLTKRFNKVLPQEKVKGEDKYTPEARDNFSKAISSYIKDNDQNLEPEIKSSLTMMRAQFKRVGEIAQDTHIAAGFTTGLGYHLQQGCGQGKSSAVASAVLIQRNSGKQVFATSSTPDLASQTFGDIAGYFDDIIRDPAKDITKESIFLMTPKGPEVASRMPDGQMETKNKAAGTNEIGFDKNGCSKTEPARFVIKDGEIQLAERKNDGKDRLGWEAGAVEWGELPPEQQKEALQLIYKEKDHIIMADNATIVQHNMMGAIPAIEGVSRHVVMDEGDYVKNDQYHYLQQEGEEYSKEEQDERNNFRIIARSIIKKLKEQAGNNFEDYIKKDSTTQYAEFTDKGIDFVSGICDKLIEQGKIKNKTDELFNFIEEAMVVEFAFVKGVDYVVEGDKVISQEKASGANIELPHGIAQAIAIKEGKTMPPEKKVYNIQTIVGAYNKIFGEDGQTRLSGAHEKATQEAAVVVANLKVAGKPDEGLLKGAKTDEEKVNAILQNTRFRTMMQNQSDIDEAILTETDIILDSGRPVLIGCVSSNDTEEIKKQIIAEYGGSQSDKEEQIEPPKVIEVFTDKKGREIRLITDTAERKVEYESEYEKIKKAKKEFLQENNITEITTKEQEEAFKKIIEPIEESIRKKYGISKGDKIPDEYAKFIKSYGGRPNTIVVGTSIVGRGTNIGLYEEKTTDENGKEVVEKVVNNRGGLHVITRGLHPSSVRQMIQFINRSMRGKENGSSHEFFSVEEIVATIPQIDEEIRSLIDEIKQLPEGDEKTNLSEMLNDAKLALKTIIEMKKNPVVAPPLKDAKSIESELLEGNATIQVDNDGNPVKAEENACESAYRAFYDTADRRNDVLSKKARVIEKLVSVGIYNIKSEIIIRTTKQNLENSVKTTNIVIPEFVGRALEIQYKANGHTNESITQQCLNEIKLLTALYITKAAKLMEGLSYEEVNEHEIINSLASDYPEYESAAKRVLPLSERQKEQFKSDYYDYTEIKEEELLFAAKGGREEIQQLLEGFAQKRADMANERNSEN